MKTPAREKINALIKLEDRKKRFLYKVAMNEDDKEQFLADCWWKVKQKINELETEDIAEWHDMTMEGIDVD